MTSKARKVDDSLHPLLKYVSAGSLFQACFDAITRNPESAPLGNGSVDLSGEFVDSTPEQVSQFRGKKDCELSLTEALSLCYMTEYMKERHHKNQGYDYYISVQIEKLFHSEKDKLEWYFGDGLIRWVDGRDYAECPFQETKAVNYTPATSDKTIEDEIIRVINKKTADTKRGRYNDICGLLISVLPKASNIDYRKVLAAVDISNYSATYLIEYSNDFKSGTVIDLLSHKGSDPAQPLTITPQLVAV